MAAIEINLLPQEAKVNLHYLKLSQAWRRRLVILLLAFSINAGLLLAGQWWLNNKIARLRQKQKRVYSQMARFSPHFQQQLIARQNIRNAAEILKKRRLFSHYLQILQAFLGQGTVLNNIHFRGNSLTAQGFWPKITDFGSFEDKAVKFRHWLPAAEFPAVDLQRVTLKPEGAYFTLVLRTR